MRRRSWKPSQKKRTRTVSRSGNTVGISVCVGEESSLMETQTCNFQIQYFFDLSPRIFWTNLVKCCCVTSWIHFTRLFWSESLRVCEGFLKQPNSDLNSLIFYLQLFTIIYNDEAYTVLKFTEMPMETRAVDISQDWTSKYTNLKKRR